MEGRETFSTWSGVGYENGKTQVGESSSADSMHEVAPPYLPPYHPPTSPPYLPPYLPPLPSARFARRGGQPPHPP